MKISRFIKLRTFSRDLVDIALEQNRNPLKRKVHVPTKTREYTTQWLEQFKDPLNAEMASSEP